MWGLREFTTKKENEMSESTSDKQEFIRALAESEGKTGARSVLVVDDEPTVRRMVSRSMKGLDKDLKVHEAENGQEALDLAIDPPDVVVLDVNLPDIDGFEVCKILRRREKTARTPIIHLSATFVTASDKVQGLDAGADGYLTHPVEPPVLIATVNAFLRARTAEEQMRRSEEKFRAIFNQALNGIANGGKRAGDFVVRTRALMKTVAAADGATDP
jgi:DNA-binding response OmpR family regulator